VRAVNVSAGLQLLSKPTKPIKAYQTYQSLPNLPKPTKVSSKYFSGLVACGVG